jgi:hypothetical protein
VRRDALKEEKREAMKGREALLVRKGEKERRGKVKGGKFFIGTLLQAVGPYIAPDRSEKWLFSWLDGEFHAVQDG